MATALVTGSTSGIGESFARLLGEKGYDLILVARDVPRLEAQAQALREKYKIDVEVLPSDLSQSDQLAKVEARLKVEDRPVSVLINNAGFGLRESFLHTDADAEDNLLDVLSRAPMRLMHAVLPGMKARDEGTIINVTSVSAWIAGGSYSAAKSYLTVLSESLHTEMRGTGVKVHALVPGFTHTEFHQRGRMNMSSLPNMFWLDADEVVAEGWIKAQAGAAISVPGQQYKILSTIARFGPRPLVRKLGMNVRRRQRRGTPPK